ncbi:MAG TPA: hypothetical protein VF281_04720 [Candidatus Saccharimonadales bacterium]
MNKITQAAIDELAQPQPTKVISIYLPTHRDGSPLHRQEDQTRLKNLVRIANDQWHAEQNDEAIFNSYNQLMEKLDDSAFWQRTTEGMAIFMSPDSYSIYHLPIGSQERVCIDDSYDITPLLVVMAYDQPYYLLTLAMHNTKLFYGDMYGLEPVTIDFPTSPEDALNIDEMFSGSHTIRNQDSGGGSAAHGQGDSNGAGREERLQYFRIIDAMIADSSSIDSALPVLIAATDSEAGDYRRLSKLPSLIHTYIQGNHTNSTLADLHALAWPIIQTEVTLKQATATMEEFHEGEGIKKSSRHLRDIVEAAKMGRIKTLLVGMTKKTTDTVSDAIHAAVPILTFAKQYDNDHITQLVRIVLAQGGTILGINRELLPATVTVAAIYRY